MYVYRFLNKEGEIIYIGKANNLKSRLSNHKHLSKKCYEERSKIEYIKLNNDNESRIYEIYLINKHYPKYNKNFNAKNEFSFELPEKEWKEYKVRKSNRSKKKFIYEKDYKNISPLFYDFVKSLNNEDEKEIFTGFFWQICNTTNKKKYPYFVVPYTDISKKFNKNYILDVFNKYINTKIVKKYDELEEDNYVLYEEVIDKEDCLYIKIDIIISIYFTNPIYYNKMFDGESMYYGLYDNFTEEEFRIEWLNEYMCQSRMFYRNYEINT